jgi:CBS domain-containing protein
MEKMIKRNNVGVVEESVASDLSLADNHHELVVRDIMSRDVVTATSSDTILAAAAKMSENNVSCVVVVDDGHVTGILTQKDVLQGVAAEEVDFHLQKVSKRMSSPVEVISAGWSVMDAGKFMESKGIKRLPVAKGRKLVGIVTQSDITRGLISLTSLRYVSDIMCSAIVAVDAETTVAEAAHIMSYYNVSSIVAEYQKRLVGILTERDLLKRVVALSKDPAQTRVADVMSFPVTSVPPSYSIISASNMMEKMHIHRLVIVDGKKACGIVTQTDIMWAVRGELNRREEERQGLLAELLVRRCPECAAPLRPRQRYCEKCARKRRLRTRREHQQECQKTQKLSVR